MKIFKKLIKIPNLTLLTGAFAVLVIMLLFSRIQYISSSNIWSLEMQLRNSFQLLAMAEDHDSLDPVQDILRELQEDTRIAGLIRTLQDKEPLFPDNYASRDRQTLIQELHKLGMFIDHFYKDQIRATSILTTSFSAMVFILTVLVTVSVMDQKKKMEKARERHITEQKLLDLLEEERNLIALELHDEIAQKLSLINQHFLCEGYGHTELFKRYSKDVIERVRSLSHSLRSPDFPEGSLKSHLEHLFSDFQSLSSISLNTEMHGMTVLETPEEWKLHVFRVIQELLTNCRKHSGARNLHIRILYSHPEVIISYRDDGVGLPLPEQPDSLGLKGIRYRLNILNARMNLQSDNGLIIHITIPVTP